MATLSDPSAADETTFRFEIQGAAVHPATKTTVDFTASVFVDTNASADQMRKQIGNGLKDIAVIEFANSGATVSRDRIAVTLL